MYKTQKWIGKLILTIQYKLEKMAGIYNSSIVNNPTGSGFISGKVKLQYPEHIIIGSDSYVNGGQLIASPNAYIKIGKNCLISYNVHLRTDMHYYKEGKIPIREQGSKEADIIVGDDVWIGFGAQILGGVTLGEGCVIGAGTVVTKDVMPYEVVVGGAMRVIGERTQGFDDKEKFR
jgi:acetyltransferase-like isoleucine patch superfamily enzyme